ncbi:hypothetical protein AUJ42_01340 [Candidatus Collierbacteria bacterium CG1_02_44_10]|uniref:MBL fold hydrolase n=4 Tax=Candidatus Collieribacteriota TaxID=1752725 RepID=A0A2H0DST6_9BACT|nr:MBL fold metallo-hydrolase [bacterium]OIN91718.1 MAG: hypothetical protein AUJ42_01340 [Candidatus Collierbacteria bacterium CG1_02_44_10]PIP85226.1 MAG: MBL fold hydrolase [Candidatus Collierbacteria bacterium CG22_combo_CG10-13_8_21_14_all_43_12]PIR99570.1 MAG: MBL fold hydrolase [Candidatus Collierbacteria bacterium CG10_big_fil_rev_8_21_14_0_10_43_36]PIZ24971.1 MAG: MBL fold hydrolase [Candidatus Collierbacteria bacterium CG_4_10_14_0_8_um_filter_43_86]PJB48237.1 MAG: MBL fold hydrolase
MKITPLIVGQMSTNCYLVSDEQTKQAIIIDPGEEGDFISTTILENKLVPMAIVLTHGHYDHCLAALELKLNFNPPIYLHRQDLFLYEKAHLSAARFSSIAIPKLPPIDHFLVNNEVITFGQSNLKVLHTPGHTPGSICLLSPTNNNEPKTDKVIFTGDTLFANGVGSTNHTYSSTSDLHQSLSKLKTINLEQTTSPLIYPGHENTPVSFPILKRLGTTKP